MLLVLCMTKIRLANAKSPIITVKWTNKLLVPTKNCLFVLVGFYGISNLVDYQMSKPLSTLL